MVDPSLECDLGAQEWVQTQWCEQPCSQALPSSNIERKRNRLVPKTGWRTGNKARRGRGHPQLFFTLQMMESWVGGVGMRLPGHIGRTACASAVSLAR